jgi:predicted TPR repeat methyltransferase
MLTKARGRGLYDALIQGDLVAVLAGTPAQWDVVVAADVLIYLGDWRPSPPRSPEGSNSMAALPFR